MSKKKKINVFAIPDRSSQRVGIYKIKGDDFVLLNYYTWQPNKESVEHSVRQWEHYSNEYEIKHIKII
jgi:hypothetical protein